MQIKGQHREKRNFMKQFLLIEDHETESKCLNLQTASQKSALPFNLDKIMILRAIQDAKRIRKKSGKIRMHLYSIQFQIISKNDKGISYNFQWND